MDELNIKLGQNINTLNAYLDASELPRPSFDRDTPPVVLPHDAPPEVQDARQQIMDASLRLFRLAAGPSEYISNFRTGFNETAVVQWLVHFQIFDIVPTEKSISYAELADKANVAVVHAKSIIRMAMTSGVFEEPEPQQVGHSAISLYIRNNQHERTRAS
ncbi:uncharacterized protein APUU_60066A [Aspergillus puulaauensis]|uniref:O-methyltransferase dimerisation domain-containing protein n=1 Tax=Aspergillus puulaauensis TaxID=1220207 RepID=A0A7R7XU47_9EURO|nr:uncharacterized protein APUU_60066A [Aspergillus puulaauensis]BCS27018.1 hypothetical protein APUU_60066A [Aspergillus puulaauensis]